jgi:hypothetical protein
MVRYMSGLCACGLGLAWGGWLAATAVLLRGTPSNATMVSLSAGAGIALASAIGLACWSQAWRQRMRLDGARAGRVASPGVPAGGVPGGGFPAGGASAGSITAGGVPAGGASAGGVTAGGARRSRRALRRGARRPARTLRPASAAHSHRPARRAGDDPPLSPAEVLTELRAILEPLLTTGPAEAAGGGDGEETW